MKSISNSPCINLFIKCMLIVVSLSCENAYRVKFDYDIAVIEILGRDICKEDKSAWIISLDKINPRKTYGDEIYYNNRKYTNVVKTYFDLSEQEKDTANKYSIEIVRNELAKSVCTVGDSLPKSLNIIEIQKIRITY